MNPVDPTALKAALETKTPTKKKSLVRQLMPKIREAMARGLKEGDLKKALTRINGWGGSDRGHAPQVY
jgi:hypothetical protein